MCVGDVGEIRILAEDGQSGQSLETSLVHPEERRDPLLQISRECVSHYEPGCPLPSKVLLSAQKTLQEYFKPLGVYM